MFILITGASRGIGAALAQSFSESGHQVLMVARNKEKLQIVADKCNQRAGEMVAHPIPFDLTEICDLEREFFSLITNLTNNIDAIVNGAGQLIRKPFEKITIDEARGVFETNLFAPAQLIRILRPLLDQSTLRHIVNITSMAGFQGSSKFSGLSYYSASKAALGSLTECLAEEYMEFGIKVNALAIGAVQTEMLSEAFPGYEAELNADEMAEYLKWFTLEGHRFFNGKILPVSVTTP